VKPFLAMIVPAHSGAHPDHELPKPPTSGGSPGAPDHTLPGDLPKPSHPIWYPLPPGAPVDPEYGVPEGAYPDQGLPGSQPHPDQGLPGPQPHPEHPIVLPPDAGGGWGPIYIWGGGPGARPPIALPPDGQEPEGKIEWRAAWTPTTGWVTFGVVVPEKPHVTPSKK
jgi:hypothetical protein